MFVVERTKTKLTVDMNVVISKESKEYENLYDAINYFEQLKKVDEARFEVLALNYNDFYIDSNSNKTSYHYVIGQCKISCEIIGVLNDAIEEFFVKY